MLRLLRSASLPEDIEPHFDNFAVADRGGVIVGAVGLELLGADALLRSLVVHERSRRGGIGKSLADEVIDQARSRSIRKLFLLTIDAASFFERIGFVHIPHAAAPPEVRATREFSELCPSTARLMTIDLESERTTIMDDLTFKEREFVALGAALGSNCAPCVEYHIGEAREAGLTDAQISAAVRLADKVRKVPSAKALDAALAILGGTATPEKAVSCEPTTASKAPGCCN